MISVNVACRFVLRGVCGAFKRNVIVRHKSSKKKVFIKADDDDNRHSVDTAYHVPVMKKECCDFLNIESNGVFVDCTLGAGGHSVEILARGGYVIGFDQDPDAINKASDQLKQFIDDGKLEIIQSNFRHIRSALECSKLLAAKERKDVDGVLMDLGVSSYQINEPSRGFAFGANGPLDMRMDKGQVKVTVSADASPLPPPLLTAMTIVNTYDITSLANIFYQYGDEQRSRQIARNIVLSRPLSSTGELEHLISQMTSFKDRSQTLARCFQALRIVVNDEIGALEEALLSMHEVIRPGGRLAVMSYHSLEDRRVKRLFKTGTLTAADDNHHGGESDDFYAGEKSDNPWAVLTKRAVSASEEELQLNRRSRSAKLRVAQRK